MNRISERQPYSKSKIWDLQRDYFNSAGINAWSSGEVPHYITSNPVVGKTYAELVFALLRDRARSGDTLNTVYLLELGAGHGRLCHHFLKHMEKLLELCPVALPPFCYVLSDFTQQNLDFWKDHPRFQPYFQSGVLDYALFDACETRSLRLQHRNTVIQPGQMKQPLVALANYFFDTIPQELFHIKDETLSLTQVEIEAPEDGAPHAAEQLKNLKFHYHDHPVQHPFYQEPALNQVLEEYTASLEDTHLLFPHVGMQCLLRLKALSKSGVVLITADKGLHHIDNLDHCDPPTLATHGSFSLTVNFHALMRFAEKSGGLAIFPTNMTHSLVVGCLVLGYQPQQYKELQLAYEREVDRFGPDDYFSLKKLIETHLDNLSFRDIMAVIRLSGYDARFFHQLFPRLYGLIEDLDDIERWALFQMTHQFWDHYFPIREEADLAMNLGNILMALDFPKEALMYFQLSIQIYGNTAAALFNCGLCHYCIGEPDQAIAALNTLLKTNESDQEARDLLKTIEDEVKNGGPEKAASGE